MSITNVIQAVQRKLHEAVSDLQPWFDQGHSFLHFQPKDGGWTALQILEHIVLTSHYLLILIDKGTMKALHRAQTMPVAIDWENYALSPPQLENVGVHKSFSWARPAHMEPTGKHTAMEIRKKFDKQVMDCLNYLNCMKKGEGVLCQTTMTVNGIGKLDVYQYIYFLALHAIRHVKQLEENEAEFMAVKKLSVA
jgi:hypothetical protein